MRQKTVSFFSAIFMFIGSLAQLIFTPNVIRVDFDNVVDEIRPVHNIGRMPEYETGSEVNRLFTEANMTSCRTHDIRATDIHNIFPDFSKDADDESAYSFSECDKVIESIIDTGMEPFFRLGVSYSHPVREREFLLPPNDYDKWAQICEHIIMHYNEGWADGFDYNIKYWEIWNEPENSYEQNRYHRHDRYQRDGLRHAEGQAGILPRYACGSDPVAQSAGGYRGQQSTCSPGNRHRPQRAPYRPYRRWENLCAGRGKRGACSHWRGRIRRIAS